MTLQSKQTRDVDESKYSMNTAATKMTNECDTNISGTNELNYAAVFREYLDSSTSLVCFDCSVI